MVEDRSSMAKQKSASLSSDGAATLIRMVHRCSWAAMVIAAMILIAFLAVCRSPDQVFLPVLGGSLLTDGTALRTEDHLQSLATSSYEIQVLDVVNQPEEDNEALFLLKLPPSYLHQLPTGLSCVSDGSTVVPPVLGLDLLSISGPGVVRCPRTTSGSGTVSLRMDEQDVEFASDAEVLDWNKLVFWAISEPEDVVVFTKGIITKRGSDVDVKALSCTFGGGTVVTMVTHASQEVIRCSHPPASTRKSLFGRKVTVKFNGVLLPSVARYGPPGQLAESNHYHPRQRHHDVDVDGSPSKHLLCACTMVYNISKFLKEWVAYHAFLGVDRFFLYDNNSEDDLHTVVEELRSSSYNVSRHLWPWIKSQEAGFSHCAVRAQSECRWMAFIDVDEFVFPKSWLRDPQPLATLVEDFSNDPDLGAESGTWWRKFLKTDKPVGQIFLGCNVFGPSGLSDHPHDGVTQGYTCRMRKSQRHKSIVKLEAVDKSLLNVVHHFQLQAKYRSVNVPASKGVIQHYKYQVWSEFKAKFKRRVSTYVTDWKKSKSLDSKDRTPGLGTDDVEPRNWRHRFCEVNDTAMQRYVAKTFGAKEHHGSRRLRFPWV